MEKILLDLERSVATKPNLVIVPDSTGFSADGTGTINYRRPGPKQPAPTMDTVSVQLRILWTADCGLWTVNIGARDRKLILLCTVQKILACSAQRSLCLIVQPREPIWKSPATACHCYENLASRDEATRLTLGFRKLKPPITHI